MVERVTARHCTVECCPMEKQGFDWDCTQPPLMGAHLEPGCWLQSYLLERKRRDTGGRSEQTRGIQQLFKLEKYIYSYL